MSGERRDAKDPIPEDVEQIFEQFGDIFGQLFGNGARPSPGGAPPKDARRHLRITFAEAAEGTQREIDVQRFFGCADCAGRGGEEGSRLKPCIDCGGDGQRVQQQGFFQIQTACAACRGRGGSWDRPCAACDGAGGVWKKESLTVTVPGGVSEGQLLRLAGKGNAPAGGEPGNLLLAILVGPDPRLERDGADLRARVTVSKAVARDGGVVKVPVPRGAIDVRVPAGAKTGDTLRLRGYGAIKLGSPTVPLPSGDDDPYRSVDPSGHRGDLVVLIDVEGQRLPVDRLPPEEREVVQSDRRFLYGAGVAGVVLVVAWVLSHFT